MGLDVVPGRDGAPRRRRRDHRAARRLVVAVTLTLVALNLWAMWRYRRA